MHPTTQEITLYSSQDDKLHVGYSNQEEASSSLSSSTHSKAARHPNLSLQIPSKALDLITAKGGNGLLLQCPASLKGATSSSSSTSSPRSVGGGFLRALSLKRKNTTSDAERSSLLKPGPQQVSGSPNASNVMSKFNWKRCSSLPLVPASDSLPTVSTPSSARTASEQSELQKEKVSRSLSVPMRNKIIVRSQSIASGKVDSLSDSNCEHSTSLATRSGSEEEILEEEAICRICFDSCDEGNTFKLECSCRGALRLIHEECAIKWFGTRKNKNCDVCGREVLNLPVTLFRVSSSAQQTNGQVQNRPTVSPPTVSAWQDFVVLVLISTICYFFFIEQLLIQDLKSRAVIIAAPFSFTLGLVSSVLAIVLAIREYIWTYAAIEFAFVAVILRGFYSMLHLKALYAVPLSALLGFGLAMTLNSLCVYIFLLRRAQVSHNSNPV